MCSPIYTIGTLFVESLRTTSKTLTAASSKPSSYLEKLLRLPLMVPSRNPEGVSFRFERLMLLFFANVANGSFLSACVSCDQSCPNVE